jgi:hypothetical protein
MNFIIRGGCLSRKMTDMYILVRVLEDDDTQTSLFSIDYNGYLPVTMFGDLVCGVDEI